MAKSTAKKTATKTKSTKGKTTKAKAKTKTTPPTPATTTPPVTTATATATTATTPTAPAPSMDFGEFMKKLEKVTVSAKLSKATSMLKAERFRLYAKVEDNHLVGVVKSQTNPDLVYSCRLGSDGKYTCGTQNLRACGGLQGSPCKHLLVLIVGLSKAGELDPTTAHQWTQATRGKQPVFDKDALSETFLKYKGAEAGEIDWRPTETIPEDYYAM